MLLIAIVTIDGRPRTRLTGPWVMFAVVVMALCATALVDTYGWPKW